MSVLPPPPPFGRVGTPWDMSDVLRCVRDVDATLLMSAVCDPENCLCVDPRRAAMSLHGLAASIEGEPPSLDETAEVVQVALRRVTAEGAAFSRSILRAKQLVVSPAARVNDVLLETARAVQVRELHKQVMLHVGDLREAVRRHGCDPADLPPNSARGYDRRASAPPTGWWQPPASPAMLPETLRREALAACYAAFDSSPIVTVDVADEGGRVHHLSLDALGLCYLREQRWHGFVQRMGLRQIGGPTGAVALDLATSDAKETVILSAAGGWRVCGRALRGLATVAACSGVELSLDSGAPAGDARALADVVPWLLSSSPSTEAGVAVSVLRVREGDAGGEEEEEWRAGVVRGFNEAKGCYSVEYADGGVDEGLDPASARADDGRALVGSFWSRSSPLWQDKEQVVLQGLVRWMSRAYERLGVGADDDPDFFASYVRSLENGSRQELLDLAGVLVEGGRLWEGLAATVLRIGLVCLSCKVVFHALVDYALFTADARGGLVGVEPEAAAEVQAALSHIAMAATPLARLPAQPASVSTRLSAAELDALAAYLKACVAAQSAQGTPQF